MNRSTPLVVGVVFIMVAAVLVGVTYARMNTLRDENERLRSQIVELRDENEALRAELGELSTHVRDLGKPFLGLAGYYIANRGGIELSYVMPAGPALEAGLDVGWVITHINGKRIQSQADFVDEVYQHKPTDLITLKAQRSNQVYEIELRLGVYPIYFSLPVRAIM